MDAILVLCQGNAAMTPPAIHRWIKTDCGRAKYAELAARPGAMARVRLAWFVLIAALRDWRLPDQPGGSAS
ncbi:MAG: hypothetical protein FJ049_02325 [Cyanobacteria bacterium M_surface_7_m2_037]|nr:hypothetical protein [Cyanobacteria bacterium K_DeepCast_0m_m1_088]MBM5794953.1 hypothetical protein [Cyanobacteria bacterium M_surface_7_m2_037]MBM5819419.1 hypothetical protein [Cyanobacteria bacterium K_DeepCast_150m_m2_101]